MFTIISIKILKDSLKKTLRLSFTYYDIITRDKKNRVHNFWHSVVSLILKFLTYVGKST